MLIRCFISLFLLCSFFTGVISTSQVHADENNIGTSEYMIDTGKVTPSTKKITGGGSSYAAEDANYALGFIIQQLMLFIGASALLVMTIGAGYMILHRGDDASLSKGKEIFVAGILGLLVALSSYLIVSLTRFIIYSV